MREDWFECSDGSRLRVDEHGDPDAPVTLVLVHCFVVDRHDWDPVLPGLADACGTPVRVITYDHRGYGESDAADLGSATLDRLGDDLAELLAERVPHGPVVLAGHSMGGMTIMALAERHPELVTERVAGVLFLATACCELPKALTLGVTGRLAAAVHGIERLGVGLLTLLGREVITRRPALLEPVVRWLAFGLEARAADVAAVARMAAACRPSTLLNFRRTFDEHDRREALAVLSCAEATVMVGDRDRVTPPRHGALIAEWLPGSRLVILGGAGHMLPHERTAQVCAAAGDLVANAVPALTATG
jgi:pimeloyl-ACP methyl ester carboxylesterase